MARRKDFSHENISDQELVTFSAETFGSQPRQKSLWAQAELTRRLRESIRQFDRSTERYSKRMFFLTIVLLVVGLAQLMISIMAISLPFYPVINVAIWVMMIGTVAYLANGIYKDLGSLK